MTSLERMRARLAILEAELVRLALVYEVHIEPLEGITRPTAVDLRTKREAKWERTREQVLKDRWELQRAIQSLERGQRRAAG